MRHVESRIQQACVRWFSLQYPQYKGLLFAVPNGGRRDAVTGAMLKAEGVVAGVSDLILFLPRKGFHALCIEMKTQSKASKQQDTQKQWQRSVEAQGYKYIICRSVMEFISFVNEYLTESQKLMKNQ